MGFLSELLQQTAAQRDRAEHAAAAAEERQRLARVVHDGVLQALALVQRRAPELGPEGVELGRLAGEQEVRLRGLVQQDSRELLAPLGDLDLAQLLAALQTAQVHVAVPGTPATMPAETATEVLAAVESCLSNVRHHVGRDADAWVLLEALGDRWVVSVRDDGPGIPEGRLESSAAEGRLGVQQSIVGRMHDLGGTATLQSAPGQGTEWELAVPRRDRPPGGGLMTIHTEHPFMDPAADPVRRLRGRLGGAVTLWTSGDPAAGGTRAGLTVSSVMVAGGEPGRAARPGRPGLLAARRARGDRPGRRTPPAVGAPRPRRGRSPARCRRPGGLFTTGEWEQTDYGPRLVTALTWATVEAESFESVGWSDLVIARDRRGRHRRGRESARAPPRPLPRPGTPAERHEDRGPRRLPALRRQVRGVGGARRRGRVRPRTPDRRRARRDAPGRDGGGCDAGTDGIRRGAAGATRPARAPRHDRCVERVDRRVRGPGTRGDRVRDPQPGQSRQQS